MTYDGWRAPTAGAKFDPYVDRYFQSPTTANWSGDTPTITSQGWLPLQPRNQVGNMLELQLIVSTHRARDFSLLGGGTIGRNFVAQRVIVG